MEQIKLLKVINAIRYLVSKGIDTDLHSVFKHLYLADRKHFAEYGRTVSGEQYKRLKYGPVPFPLYPEITGVLVDSNLSETSKLITVLGTGENRRISISGDLDLQYLSKSDIVCLNEAISKLKDSDFNKRVDISHDTAYNNTKFKEYISLLDMARVEGVSEERIEYLEELLELDNLLNDA